MIPALLVVLQIILAPQVQGKFLDDYKEDNQVPRDRMSHYKSLMSNYVDINTEIKKDKTIKISSQIEIPESEGLRLVLEALKVIWEAVFKGLLEGFLPTVERVKREIEDDWERSFLLDWVIDMCGAMIGRQRCSQKVACRTGKLMQAKLPGAQMMVVMAESFVPPVALEWFGVMRNSVIDRKDSCIEEFQCNFSED